MTCFTCRQAWQKQPKLKTNSARPISPSFRHFQFETWPGPLQKMKNVIRSAVAANNHKLTTALPPRMRWLSFRRPAVCMPLTSSSRVGAGMRTLRFLKPRDDVVDFAGLLETKLVYINLLVRCLLSMAVPITCKF